MMRVLNLKLTGNILFSDYMHVLCNSQRTKLQHCILQFILYSKELILYFSLFADVQ